MLSAIERYEGFLRQPGRPLYLPWPDCPCCDVVDARDILQLALDQLPPLSRAALQKLVSRLDADLRRRSLPDPDALRDNEWQAAHWWRRRLHEPWPGR
ncbi:hypothetical protein [Streptomyces marincola]|uniref:hypothetical protein n=1 Tax=Streptomyces marincola TaxID=2878388 RepID=UPI001CF52633|nr:hypothetical protein [Streptomyces marincola]UCM88018.1 hypothetical protein LC193_08650 [Streptomyces marincola]